jgi:hypothetical protein
VERGGEGGEADEGQHRKVRAAVCGLQSAQKTTALGDGRGGRLGASSSSASTRANSRQVERGEGVAMAVAVAADTTGPLAARQGSRSRAPPLRMANGCETCHSPSSRCRSSDTFGISQ